MNGHSWPADLAFPASPVRLNARDGLAERPGSRPRRSRKCESRQVLLWLTRPLQGCGRGRCWSRVQAGGGYVMRFIGSSPWARCWSVGAGQGRDSGQHQQIAAAPLRRGRRHGAYRWPVSTGRRGHVTPDGTSIRSGSSGTGIRASTILRRCRGRCFSFAAMRCTAPWRPTISATPPRMAACACGPTMPRCCSRWCISEGLRNTRIVVMNGPLPRAPGAVPMADAGMPSNPRRWRSISPRRATSAADAARETRLRASARGDADDAAGTHAPQPRCRAVAYRARGATRRGAARAAGLAAQPGANTASRGTARLAGWHC